MPSTIAAEKAALRKDIKESSLSEFDRLKSDQLLLERFLSLPQVSCCSSLLLFYGVGHEPDTSQLLEPLSALGKDLALPRCLPGGQMEARRYLGKTHLHAGAFGIPEPDESCPLVERDCLSLILVPNLCCDQRGYRLGHGGGYYDRYLANYRGFTLALCRDKLLRPHLPAEPHDQPVDLVLTETRSLSFSFSEKKRGSAPLLM